MSTIFDADRMLTVDGGTAGISAQRLAELAERVRGLAIGERLVKVENGRTTPYPMLPSLVQLSAPAEEHLARHVPRIVDAWHRILHAHRTDTRVRDFLAVPAVLRRWVDASPEEEYRVDFCRFDLVGDTTETARVVEFNANCPGGVIFTSAYAALWRAVPEIAELLDAWSVAPSRLDERHWFPRFVLDVTAEEGATAEERRRSRIAIFRKPGGNVLELDKMADLFAELGYRSMQTDPGADDWLGEEVRTGYLKYGVQPTLADIGSWEVFGDRVISGKLRLPNPLPGRWIGDNKLCLALLSDPRFADMFTTEERTAVGELLPYSRKVGDGVEPAELVADRAEWVVKGPYDTRGNSVYIGSEQTSEQWRAVVERAAQQGWLAQRLVPPSHRTWRGAPGYQDLSIVLLNGGWAGYTSRISENLRVNVAQGGGRQVVFGHRATAWEPGVR